MFISNMIDKTVIGVLVAHVGERKHFSTFSLSKPSTDTTEPLSFFFITDGRMLISRAGKQWVGKKGDIIILENGVDWILRSYPDNPVSYFVMLLTPVAASGAMLDLSVLGLSNFYRINTDDAIKQLFMSLCKVFNKKKLHYLQEASILSLQILMELNLSGTVGTLTRGAPLHEQSAEHRIQAVLCHMETHYKERYSVEKMAALAVMHPLRFKRLFKKVTGIPPHRYVLERKIERAKDFILYFPEEYVSIAQELGFYDSSHFYRVFLKITGMTPGEFRRKTMV